MQPADRTVREVIPPWHVIQKKMADKEAANGKRAQKVDEPKPVSTIVPPPPAAEALMALSAFEEAPPSSGVRLSEPSAPVAAMADEAPESGAEPGLSFKVYTLADLERRSDAPVAMSMRASRVAFDGTISRSAQHALRAKNAVMAFVKAVLAWAKTSKMEREPAKIALRAPFDVMGDELEFVARAIDWKKAGVYTGIAVGASLTLLFGVLTAAELTDDLHPSGRTHRMSMESSGAVTPPTLAAPAPPPATTAIPAAAAPAAEETVELDPPTPAPKKAGKKAPKKKLAFRNADDIFKP